MMAAAAGAVIDPVGTVLSTRTLAIVADVSGVPDVVGGDDAQVVEPVGGGGGVPAHGVRGRRVGGADDWPRCPRRAGVSGTAPTPTPGPASAELDVTTTEPRTFALATGAVTAPVGTV